MERRKNHVNVWKDTWVDHYLDLPCRGRAVLIGFLAMLLGIALDEAVHAFKFPWVVERLVENAGEGLLIGLIVYWLSCLREKRVERRMREIGFLNHHIRNAMQTIELTAAKEIADAQHRATVDRSIRRVVETLSRINRESDDLTLKSPPYTA